MRSGLWLLVGAITWGCAGLVERPPAHEAIDVELAQRPDDESDEGSKEDAKAQVKALELPKGGEVDPALGARPDGEGEDDEALQEAFKGHPKAKR